MLLCLPGAAPEGQEDAAAARGRGVEPTVLPGRREVLQAERRRGAALVYHP